MVCGKHTKEMQIRSVVQMGEAAYKCSQCDSKGALISKLQQQATECIEALPGVGRVQQEQRRVPHVQHPFDILLEDYGIKVEVDGKHHDEHSGGWGEEPGQQWARDRALDRSVLSTGGRLVRLHYKDSATWQLCMLAAMHAVCSSPSSSFIYYSPSYPPSSRITSNDL